MSPSDVAFGMWHCVAGQVFPGVSKDRSALFRIGQAKNEPYLLNIVGTVTLACYDICPPSVAVFRFGTV